MRRIDRETVQRILDTADIVEVVSDFVRLKKRGANYIGLCPFHAERTPSFSVSKARGYCKCFSCGKGGSPVGFIMEHESMTYNEALRYLAKKYNIEIKETEVTEEERQSDQQRESMLAINEWASSLFHQNLYDSEEGRNIGLTYFRERGLNNNTIDKYRLGYSINRTQLPEKARIDGYNEKYLLETGLCYKKESNGSLVDRFHDRVIYPIFGLSGKILAFGGRTLTSDKKIAKYVNSPESIVYIKSNELYGLYQAKQSINKKGYVILVEGYMDVLSMAQSGIENVVASSGTSLTQGQIRMIHRFTDKVILMYDSDPAGIKAAIRGVDLLLAEGLDITIVLLPEGDDPDSFAQSHSSLEVEKYIEEKQQDFIKFKTEILLGESLSDPIARSNVIKEIVNTIALIPDVIRRMVYCQECSTLLEIKEEVLTQQVGIARKKIIEKLNNENKEKDTLKSIESGSTDINQPTSSTLSDRGSVTQSPSHQDIVNTPVINKIVDCEREILKYIVRYAFSYLCECVDSDGNNRPMSVLEFIACDINADKLKFINPLHEKMYNYALSVYESWKDDYSFETEHLEEERARLYNEGIEKIRLEAVDLNDINIKEERLLKDIDDSLSMRLNDYRRKYFENKVISSADDEIRNLGNLLVTDKHRLSKYHTRYTKIVTEEERLQDLIGRSLNAWKYAMIELRIADLLKAINEASVNINRDMDKIQDLMKRKLELDHQKAQFAHILGERVFGPPN